MKNTNPAIILFLSLAVAAGGIWYGLQAANQESGPLREKTVAPAQSGNDAADVDSDDVITLRQQLADRDAELERLRAELARRPQGTRSETFQERMSRMKAEDPARYEELVQRRSERKEEMRYSQAGRLAAFMDLDTSRMTPEELANHNLLLEKLNEIWQKTGDYDPAEPPTRELMLEMYSSLREVSDLMVQERSVMFRQLGSEVGLSAAEAEEFAAYAESIISATTLRLPSSERGPYGSN